MGLPERSDGVDAALAASTGTAAGRADGDAPEGNAAVALLASMLLLGTAYGAFRQWKLQSGKTAGPA